MRDRMHDIMDFILFSFEIVIVIKIILILDSITKGL